MRNPTEREAFSDMETWAMRQFAVRAFQILQERAELPGGQLTDVEITDDQGRTALASFRVTGDQVSFVVNAVPKPPDLMTQAPRGEGHQPLAETLLDKVDAAISSVAREAANPHQAAFESYWAGVDEATGELGSITTVARQAFLAGLAHRDTGQPA